jgi:hypothetical protein
MCLNHGLTGSQLSQSGVAVEKLHFLQNSRNLGDRKCLGKSRKSFIGLPNANFFSAIFRQVSFSTATGDFTHHPES